MKKLTFFFILVTSTIVAIAQQATVIDPNAITVPRFASQVAANTAIPSPTQGMFIYRNDTQSFWYYTSAGWSNLAAAVSGAWSATGSNISNTNSGNVGIGVANPSHPLETKGRIRIRDSGGGESAGIWFNTIGNTGLNTFLGIDPSNKLGIYSPVLGKNIFSADMVSGGIRLDGPAIPNSGSNMLSLGGYGKLSMDAVGVFGGRFSILENGNVGINNNNPSEKLELNGNVKINNGMISFTNPNITSSHSISSGSDGYLRVNGVGISDAGQGIWFNSGLGIFSGIKLGINNSIAINGNEGAEGQFLTSNGTDNAVSWKSFSSMIQNLYMKSPAFSPPNNSENQIPFSTITFTAPKSGKLIISPTIKTYYACVNPFDHCHISANLTVKVDGDRITVTNSPLVDTFQSVFAFAAESNVNSIGPYVVDVPSGTHTITFHYTLNTLTPAPQINIAALAQFISN